MVKNTKMHDDMKTAIKEQDLDVNYFIREAESIARELKKKYSDRTYIYEKIRNLRELEDY